MKCFSWMSLRFLLVLIAIVLGACAAPSPAPAATVTQAPAPEPTATTVPAPTATSRPAATEASTPTTAPTLSATAAPDLPFTLTSTAFAEGETIPDRYTYRLSGQCDGANLSPELTWVGAPANTQSFAVLVNDPDGGDWAHWVQFNIPGDATALPEAAAGPDIGVKGRNDFGELGYGGPCPPGGTHRYIFTLYALDTTLALAEGVTRVEVLAAMEDHILGTAQLTGLRSR